MNIFVGNVSRNVNNDELREAFEAFGAVSSAAIIMDKLTGTSRGFGFVEMPDAEEAKNAIENMNGKELKGRPLNVNEARPKEDRPRRSFGNDRNRGNFSKRY
ncbi:MAG TPA: RNA-binding protein [Candidatus Cloacimonadota bacterium]|jgi:RNA recognition motif-containing protein|nr:RNA-binding protein [Candidatus Cloacimonadales bacterium]HPY95919.1 RNA-binding protein [Candidatus Cloacimonadota bacterium]HQB40900.1 RNA-binding protein [Candidatus Cloacimonadota bacterium]